MQVQSQHRFDFHLQTIAVRVIGCCLCMVLVAWGQSNQVHAEDSLPPIEDVLVRIREVEGHIKTLQVHEVSTSRQRPLFKGDKIYEMPRECQWTLTADGQRHFIATGENLRFQADGTTTSPFKVEVAFDGKLSKTLQYSPRDLSRPFSGRVAALPTRYSMLPTEFTVLWQSESLSEILSKRPYKVIQQDEFDGRSVYVIEGEPVERDDWFWSRQIHFDYERGIPVKTAYVMKPELTGQWIEYAVWTGADYIEVISDVWLPTKFRKYSFSVQDRGKLVEFSDGYVGTYSNWKVNEPIPASRFTLKFPDNMTVNDNRPGGDGRLLSKEEIEKLNQSVIED